MSDASSASQFGTPQNPKLRWRPRFRGAYSLTHARIALILLANLLCCVNEYIQYIYMSVCI